MQRGIVEKVENQEIKVRLTDATGPDGKPLPEDQAVKTYSLRNPMKLVKGPDRMTDDDPQFEKIEYTGTEVKVGDEVALHGPPKAELHTVRIVKSVDDVKKAEPHPRARGAHAKESHAHETHAHKGEHKKH